MKNYLIFMLFCFSVTLKAQPNIPISEFIKIDQFGYLPNATKVAVISDPITGFNSNLSFTAGNTYQVRRWSDNAVVFSGAPQIWNGGAEHVQSGDQGWWFDFSSVTASGSYYIYDVNNNVQSGRFEINANVYSMVMKAAGRMYYYNRSGIEKAIPFTHSDWTDGISFLQDFNCPYLFDQGNASLQKDLSGGWYDAGDYNKYTTYTTTTLHSLLWAYEDNASVFSDDWDIPESGNGIADILDEVKWELDWLMKMNNPDGSTHNKVGILAGGFDISPPSSDMTTRFYGPTCTSASISVASTFAHASFVFRSLPGMASYAQELENRAIASWNYVLPFINNNTLETDCDNGEIVWGDADWTADRQLDYAIEAAVYLFDITGNNAYSQFVVDNYPNTDQFFNGWNFYERSLIEALLLYTTLPGADAATAADIITKFTNSVTFSTAAYGVNDLDLYRSHISDLAYHHGSNTSKLGLGILNQFAVKYGINPANAGSYNDHAMAMMHYLHGINPIGITYLSNMYDLGAERSVNEITHGWFADDTPWDNALTSLYGPPPGFVSGGANWFYGGNLPFAPSPPSGQPHQKSFHDFNSQTYMASALTEPAIYYQAAYIRLLSAYTGQAPTCPNPGTPCNDGDANTINDMYDGLCNCRGTVEFPDDCELIHNGTFDYNFDGWRNWGSNPNLVNEGIQVINIQSGASPWFAALFQSEIPLTQNVEYRIAFDAFASSNRKAHIKIGTSGVDNGHFYQEFDLYTSPQSYSFVFTMGGPSTLAGIIEFHIGISDTDVTFDNISIIPTSCGPNCREELELPNVNTSGTYQAGVKVKSDAILPNGSTVLYHAGQCVELNEGFEVGVGIDFTAEIEPCEQ